MYKRCTCTSMSKLLNSRNNNNYLLYSNNYSGVSSNAGRANATKILVINTCMETFVQLYSFATNSALRSENNINNLEAIFFFYKDKNYRLFTWKKLMAVWAEVLEWNMVARLRVALCRTPRVDVTQNIATSSVGNNCQRAFANLTRAFSL